MLCRGPKGVLSCAQSGFCQERALRYTCTSKPMRGRHYARICVMATHVKSGAPPYVAPYKQNYHLLGAHGSPTFSAVSAISLQMSSPEADAPMTTTVRPLKASLSR